MLQEPPVGIDHECHPELLSKVASADCLEYPDVFTGEIEEFPVPKVTHAVQMGFDVDILEILLHELDDVVDIFFLIESTRAHHKSLLEPLMWEHLKHTPRFIRFRDKVYHFILDDGDLSPLVSPTHDFEIEGMQEHQRWLKIKQWNQHNRVLSDRDLIGFGDIDEIPSRRNVNLLKQCVHKDIKKSVDIGIWFPYGDLTKAFRCDWSVPGHPFAYGDPTYFKVGGIDESDGSWPTRKRGNSGRFLLGGAHLTNYHFGPQLMIKRLTTSEYYKSGDAYINKLREALLSKGGLTRFFNSFVTEGPDHFAEKGRLISLAKARADKLDDFDRIVYVPWFLRCNKDRFPGWYGVEDPRTV